jgi:1-acyl-sn-glycerol-3-phosphate acyltransferase
LSTARQWAGSVLFTVFLFLSVPFYAAVALLAAPGGYRPVYAIARSWVSSALFALKLLCRLDYRVEGLEHMPARNAVVLMKHSSAWETLAQLRIFPRQTWVVKRELMWAPFFGWVLSILKPIAIDRKGGRESVEQVIRQGSERLEEGFWVVVFPEGTRVPAGETRRYGLGGALLARETGRPVVPVAHNAGDFWPRRGWLKRAGTVRVAIGPPIATAGRDPRDINAQAQCWIEAKIGEIRQRARAPGERVAGQR